MERRIRIGELLVEARLITREQLAEILARQAEDGRRIGTLLVEAGLVSETRITQILSQQLSIPWVSLYHVDFSRQLLNLVPRELAEQFCLVPIFVRKVRGAGDTLYVAMDDPSDARARELVSHYAGLPVRAMIAPPTDIRSAIRVYYGAHSQPPQPRSSRPSRSKPNSVPSASGTNSAENISESQRVARDDGPLVEIRAAADDVAAEALEVLADHFVAEAQGTLDAPPTLPDPDLDALGATELSAAYLMDSSAGTLDSLSTRSTLPSEAPPATIVERPWHDHDVPHEKINRDSSIPIPSRGAGMPTPKRGPRPRMITLTLLDGTQVALPVRKKTTATPAQPAEPHPLTAADLITALRAVSHGADASDVLGAEPRWEPIVAALLSVLLKKHLIADWEFVEELKEIEGGTRS